MEFLTLEMVITLQLGCWRLLQQGKKQLLVLISLMCTRTRNYIGKSFVIALPNFHFGHDPREIIRNIRKQKTSECGKLFIWSMIILGGSSFFRILS